MKPPVYCLVDFKVRPDRIAAARSEMRRLERRARGEPGCIQYHFLQDQEDPTTFTGYGIWASEGDAERHYAAVRQAADDTPTLRAMLAPDRPVTRRMLDRI